MRGIRGGWCFGSDGRPTSSDRVERNRKLPILVDPRERAKDEAKGSSWVSDCQLKVDPITDEGTGLARGSSRKHLPRNALENRLERGMRTDFAVGSAATTERVDEFVARDSTNDTPGGKDISEALRHRNQHIVSSLVA